MSKLIKSLDLCRLIIDLTAPIIIFTMILISQYYDVTFISGFGISIDSYYVTCRLILLLLLSLCLIASRDYFSFTGLYIFEYSLLILLSVEGSLIILSTDNLFLFFLALELQNLAFYVLASIKRYSNFSTEAGLKYFLFGAFSSSLVLFGISIVYGMFGTLNINEINLLYHAYLMEFSDMPLLFIAGFFITCGLLFKLGSSPFHWWLPDVYQGSPIVVTMFFSVVPKFVLLFVLAKYFFVLLHFNQHFISTLFFICGLLSLYFGGINALFQYNLKRFLAYSAIVNIGYILLAFSLFTLEGVIAGIIYLVTYLSSLIVLFFFIINNRNIQYNKINDVFDFSLIFSSNKLYAVIVSFLFFSLAGIPPLVGFFGKFFVFVSYAMDFSLFTLLLILLITVFTAFYYIRIVRYVYFTPSYSNSIFNSYGLSYIFVSLFLFNILFLFFIDFISEYFNLFFINYFFII